MKITIFVTYTYPYIGSGIGNVAVKQAEMLVGIGHEVTVVSSNFPKTNKEFVKNGVKHVKLSAIYLLEKIHVPVPLYLFNYKVISLIKSSDIIHIHDAVYPSSFLAALIAKIYNKKIILTQHVAYIVYPHFLINLVQKIAYSTLGKISFLLSDHIIYFNPKVRELIGGYQKESLIPNGVDLSLFYPAHKNDSTNYRKKYHLPDNKKIILFVGRFVPKKGYQLLFEARDNKYLLLFVGGGNVPEHMKMANNAVFLPAKKQKELSEIYRLSDIFILPSYGEGFPLSIQEAMASGLPIITSKVNIFDKSINFIKTIDLNVAAIRNSILELIDNNILMASMAKRSRKFAEENYSWQNNLDRLIKLYQEDKK